MSPTIAIAIYLSDNEIEAVVIEGWPRGIPKPRFAGFVRAQPDLSEDHVLTLRTGGMRGRLSGYEEVPIDYEPGILWPSPIEILKELDAIKRATASSPIEIARMLHQDILNVSARIDQLRLLPTGDNYKELFMLANNGLIKLLNALGANTEPGNSH